MIAIMNVLDTSSSSSSSEEEEVLVVRRPKIYRIRKNYFEIYDDLDFFDRFRLTKPTMRSLLEQIEPLIALPTNRGGYVQPLLQLLLVLRFYASGNMQISVADFIGISRSTACRIIKRVSRAIASLAPRYIKMDFTEAEMQSTAEAFYRIASFPRTIGAIDCTLIRIDSPGGNDAEVFRCRKGYFALNVQTISDAKLRIRNLVTRWPGSVHDQTIFNNSNLKRDFENGTYGRYMLVGDSGYSVQKYLMTKLLETHTAAENLYNESIIRTRNTVERQYGVWKRRFPILRLGMRMQLENVMNVIVATAVLHNMTIEMNEAIPEEWMENDAPIDNLQELPNGNNVNLGRQFRQVLINEHFQRLI